MEVKTDIGRIMAISITCRRCKEIFVTGLKEIKWYSKMSYPLPKRCPKCRRKIRENTKAGES